MLDTPRLRLRPFASSDQARLVAVFRDPYVRRYLWDSLRVAPATVAELIDASEQSFRARGFGLWCAAEPGGPTIGFCGLRPFDEAEVELIYGFLPEHWGRGFAGEVSRALLALGFEKGLARIWARTDLENKASERVMQRLGMRFVRRETSGALPLVSYVAERSEAPVR